MGAITISPLTVALLEADKHSQGTEINIRNVLRNFVRALARSVVWAPALALVCAYFGVHLPSYANRTLMTLGSAANRFCAHAYGEWLSQHNAFVLIRTSSG